MWMTMLWWDYSNETSSVVLSHRAVYLVCGPQLFEALEEILRLRQYFHMACFWAFFTEKKRIFHLAFLHVIGKQEHC